MYERLYRVKAVEKYSQGKYRVEMTAIVDHTDPMMIPLEAGLIILAEKSEEFPLGAKIQLTTKVVERPEATDKVGEK